MSYDICFLVSRRCPGVLTASSMTSWTETRAMTVPFCGSGQESKVFPRQSSANLPSKGGILKLNSRIHELKHFELYRRRTAAINELQNLKYLPRSNVGHGISDVYSGRCMLISQLITIWVRKYMIFTSKSTPCASSTTKSLVPYNFLRK